MPRKLSVWQVKLDEDGLVKPGETHQTHVLVAIEGDDDESIQRALALGRAVYPTVAPQPKESDDSQPVKRSLRTAGVSRAGAVWVA